MRQISRVVPLIKSIENRVEIVSDLANFVRRVRVSSKRPDVVRSAPWIFNIELTNRCPMKCVMCPRTEGMKRELGLMDIGLFKTIIDQLAVTSKSRAASDLLWLHHFGESLEHPDFHEFVNYAANKGFRPAVSINPIMLTSTIARRVLDSKLDTLLISLDGHDNDSFQKIRGLPHAYESSKSRLLDFLSHKVQQNWKGRVFFSMIYFPLNETSIKEAREFWPNQLGIDEFQIKPFVSFNGDIKSVSIHGLGLKRRKKKPFVACGLPWEKMTVTWDGDVVPCCYDYDKKYILGSIKSQSLLEIWNGEAMQALRKEFRSNDVKNSLCRDCDSLYGEDVDLAMPTRNAK